MAPCEPGVAKLQGCHFRVSRNEQFNLFRACRGMDHNDDRLHHFCSSACYIASVGYRDLFTGAATGPNCRRVKWAFGRLLALV